MNSRMSCGREPSGVALSRAVRISEPTAFSAVKYLLFFIWFSLCAHALAADVSADATAKFLAGLPVRGTPLERDSLDPAWVAHAADFDSAWTRLEQRQLLKIRAWAPQFLGEHYEDTAPMFYMFSGPDFLYANVFFPNASTYILCGTEPVGPIPNIDDIPSDVLPSALASLRKSLDSVLNWSFFITKDMKVDLNQKQLTGTLPVLYVFLACDGCTIDSVTRASLDRSGNLIDEGKGTTPGAKIVFFGASGSQQTLYYFASDLANDGIKSNPGFLKFCSQQGEGPSLLKAASYLMHEESFSQVREFLLTKSKLIVQDDSGIPWRFFDDHKWIVRYCGRYFGPIDIFKKYWQPDLANAYATTVPASLEFGFGYEWQPGRSSLIIATRP